MFDECVIHIGTEKTGSTAIQNVLANGRDVLKSQGWLYPKAFGKRDSQYGLVVLSMKDAWLNGGDLSQFLKLKSKDDWEKYRNAIFSSFEGELRECGECGRLVVSSEHFHSRLKTADEIANLRNILERWCKTFRIVVYFRRQDRVAVSLYSTAMKITGMDRPVFGDERRYYFDYLKIYDNWASVFGNESIVVRVYDDTCKGKGGVVGDFLEVCGLNEGLPLSRYMGKANPSLRRVGIDFLVAVRAIGGEEFWVKWKSAAIRYAETRWAGKAVLAVRHEARGFYEKYKDGNKELAGRLGMRGLFDDDFSEYPEVFPDYPEEYYLAVKGAAEHFVILANRSQPGMPLYGALNEAPNVNWNRR